MYCQKCGKQIADDSTFCEFCGAPTGLAPQAQTPGVQQPAQQNETVAKAQASIKSAFNAIVAVLKDPAANISLNMNEMIVIYVIAAIAHMLFILMFVSSIASSMGGSIAVSVLWTIFGGILLPIVVIALIVCAHCIENKSFANAKDYLPKGVLGCILPSAIVLVAGICMFINLVFGVVILILAMVTVLVDVIEAFTSTKKYFVILSAAATVFLLVLMFYWVNMSAIMDSSVSLFGSNVKLSELIGSALSLFGN